MAQWPHMSASVNRPCRAIVSRAALMIAGCFGQLQPSTRTEEQAEQVESESENQQMPGKVGGKRCRKLPLAVAIDVLESESKSDGARCLSMCDVATTRSDESNGRITTELKIKCYPSNMPPKNNDDDEMATATATATATRQHGSEMRTRTRTRKL